MDSPSGAKPLCSRYYPQSTQTTQLVPSVDCLSGPRNHTDLPRAHLSPGWQSVPWSPGHSPKPGYDSRPPVAEHARTEPLVGIYRHIPPVFDVVCSGCKGTDDCTILGKLLSAADCNWGPPTHLLLSRIAGNTCRHPALLAGVLHRGRFPCPVQRLNPKRKRVWSCLFHPRRMKKAAKRGIRTTQQTHWRSPFLPWEKRRALSTI